MAQIRIPFADTQIGAPSPGAGQVRTQIQPSMRDARAGQMPEGTGQRNAQVAMIDPMAAGLKGRVEGQAAQQAGVAALHAGGALDRMARTEQDLSDQTELTRRGVEAQRATAAIQEQFDTRTFASSAEAQAAFREAAGQAVRGIGEGLTGRAQVLWEARSQEIIIAREFNVGRDARTRIHQSAIATTVDGNRELANLAAASRNPVERATLMEQAEGAIRTLAESGAINPEVAGRMSRGFRQDVQMADVNRLMGTNPAAAIAMLNDQRQTPDIEADRRAVLVNQALTRQDAMAARGRAEQNLRETRAARAVSEIDGLMQNGIVPEARAEAALALARGTPLEPQVRQQISDARTMAEFRLATPARQNEMLTEAQGRVTAGSATDRDLAHAQRMAQVQQQQRTGYAQDGWMQGVRDGLIDRSEMPPPLNLGDPMSITARFNLSDRLTAARGYAVPVFSAAETAELSRQFVAAQSNPALVAQITASINAIPDERIRAATYRQLETARGDGGRMERGTLEVIGRAASGSAVQQRAAVQMTQAVTTDRSERVRAIGEGPELRAALESAMASPEMQTIQATARVNRDGEVAFNAQVGIMRDLMTQHMAAGKTPTEAARLARETVFADRVTINRPQLAQVSYDRSLNLGTPDAVERGLRDLRTQFTSAIRLDPALGSEAVSTNRELLRLAGQAEWVTVGRDRFALVAQGDYQQRVVLAEVGADRVRAAASGNVALRDEQVAPRPAGRRSTARPTVTPIEGFDAHVPSTEPVRPSVQ